MLTACRLLLVTLLASVPGCDDAGAGDPGATPCEVSQRFSLVESGADSYPVALAISGGHVGLVYNTEGSPRETNYLVATPDNLAVVDQGTLRTDPGVFVPATFFAAHQGFIAAMPRYAQSPTGIDLWQIVPGTDPVPQTLEGQAEMLSDVAGAQAGDQLHLAWTAASALNVAAGKDLATLSDRGSVALDAGTRNTALAMTTGAGGTAAVWVNRRSGPQHDALLFAELAADGTAGTPTTLVEHDRYVYETAMAFGTRRYAIATRDSRENILDVPLYLTLVEQDGSVVREGIRLTSDLGQDDDSVDIAWGGNAFAVVSIALSSSATSSEMQVFLRQVDEEGNLLFSPLQVSNATVRESGCCIRAKYSRIVPLGEASYLVVWSEQNDKLTYVIRGARVECR